jgi:hypothetical protein
MDEPVQLNPDDDGPHLSFRQAVKLLHTSHRRLKRAQEAGQFEAILINRRWAIPRREVLRMLGEKDQVGSGRLTRKR